MEMIHRFYDEYYFRPKVWVPIVFKAMWKGEERRRLYKEARDFLKLRAARNRAVKEARAGSPKGAAVARAGAEPLPAADRDAETAEV